MESSGVHVDYVGDGKVLNGVGRCMLSFVGGGGACS